MCTLVYGAGRLGRPGHREGHGEHSGGRRTKNGEDGNPESGGRRAEERAIPDFFGSLSAVGRSKVSIDRAWSAFAGDRAA